MKHALTAILLATAVTSAAPQAPVDQPPARAHHSVVYDASTRRVLVAGGSTSLDGGNTYSTFGDLWAFDGRWRSLGLAGAERSGMALAFDSKRKRVLAFGGYCPCNRANGGRYADLLELRSGQWKAISAIPSRPTTDALMVYDTRRDRIVLFGGAAAGREKWDDTWEFDGTAWKRFEGAGPGARGDFAMTYDTRRGRTVMFGVTSGPTPVSETWEFDGAAWIRSTAEAPSARRTVSMAYDSKRGRAILVGGGIDTWSWDGRAWTKLADAGPPMRYLAPITYDAARDRVVLFGGRPGFPKLDANATWEWDGTKWVER